MNHTELITRLRSGAVIELEQFAFGGVATFADEAADMIEAVLAERDEYQQAADKMAMEHKVERDTLRQQLAEAQADIKEERGIIRNFDLVGFLPSEEKRQQTVISQTELRAALAQQAEQAHTNVKSSAGLIRNGKVDDFMESYFPAAPKEKK